LIQRRQGVASSVGEVKLLQSSAKRGLFGIRPFGRRLASASAIPRGGLEGLERAVAQAVGIASSHLGKLDDLARDDPRPGNSVGVDRQRAADGIEGDAHGLGGLGVEGLFR